MSDRRKLAPSLPVTPSASSRKPFGEDNVALTFSGTPTSVGWPD